MGFYVCNLNEIHIAIQLSVLIEWLPSGSGKSEDESDDEGEIESEIDSDVDVELQRLLEDYE